MADEYLNLLGLARRANMLEIGEEACVAAIRVKKVRLAITACDAAEGTKMRVQNVCEIAGVPGIQVADTKAELGNALGKRPCATVGICDAGMAAAIVKKLSASNEEAASISEEMKEKADRILKRRKKKRKKCAR